MDYLTLVIFAAIAVYSIYRALRMGAEFEEYDAGYRYAEMLRKYGYTLDQIHTIAKNQTGFFGKGLRMYCADLNNTHQS